MDIITHILSGTAAGLTVASFMKRSRPERAAVAGLGALGGFMPDVDAISRWPGFDSAIGSRIGLAATGEDIYFGSYWYSHRGMTHSVAFALILGALVYGLVYLAGRYAIKSENYRSKGIPYAVAACSGVLMHVAGDMPTPPGPWGGIRLFWPLKGFYGGWGYVWWWNNYDVMLVMFACAAALAITIFACKDKWFACRRAVAVSVLMAALSLATYQCATRLYGFGPKDAPSWSVHETRSLEIQRNLLGENVYEFMRKLDRVLKVI